MTSLIAGSVACIILLALVAYLLIRAFRIEGERFGGNLYYAPKLKDSCAVIGLQVKFRFR